MHIVFLLSLTETIGGGDYSIFKYAETLAMLGHKVALFYISNSRIEISSVKKMYVRRKYDYVFSGSTLINPIVETIYDYIFLHPYLNQHASDINYIVGYQTHTGIKCVRLGKKYSIKTINFVFESTHWLMQQLPEWKRLYEHNIKLRNAWASYEESLKHSNIIVAISELTARETERMIGKRCDLVMYPGLPQINIASHSIKKENQIIYVGRLEESKNIHEIIIALSRINAKVRLVVCGNGSKKKELEALAYVYNVDVVFRGAVSDAEKWDEINKSLFMVFPTSFEGFGMPPMEALLFGIPCICTELPILREIYENNVEYVREHDIDQLAIKINELLTNKDTLTTKGDNGNKYVTSKYSWEISVNKLIDYIRNINISDRNQEQN